MAHALETSWLQLVWQGYLLGDSRASRPHSAFQSILSFTGAAQPRQGSYRPTRQDEKLIKPHRMARCAFLLLYLCLAAYIDYLLTLAGTI